MAIYKCKMCGGELNVSEGVTVIECEYCGTKQTVPTAKDENVQGLFNRANILRMKNEFDKAEQIYERIVQADETQAEAYWGLILCRYGIEYVEDPKTFKRIPTCHRASFESAVADEDCKSAIKYADSVQRRVYETEAAEIDRLQKEILILSQKEEPYDVFICYKETGIDGKRTQDSVIANDIYYQLTQTGYKVFYAAITLEDKLGSAYEPCIFAALNSAKVMLSIGTKPEYFNAVWVKNEWSRFLALMKKDRSRVLIPCYKDMDAYELPEEFAHLQAQDMSKIGFLYDLVRGIKKVIEADEPKVAVKETVVVNSGNAQVAPLLKRAFMFLEDGEWDRANNLCEQVLNQDPENARAYLGLLMSELKCRQCDGLNNYTKPFDFLNNYKKAMRFADDKLKSELQGYTNYIIERNNRSAYDGALNLMKSTNSPQVFLDAANQFKSISGYRDADELHEKCIALSEEARKEAIYNKALNEMNAAKSTEHYISAAEHYNAVAKQFKSISGFRDADELGDKCIALSEETRKEAIYIVALRKMNTAKSENDFKKARDEFKSLNNYKDSEKQADECEKLAVQTRIEKEKKKKKSKIIAICICSFVVLFVVFINVLTNIIIPSVNYNNGVKNLEAGDMLSAKEAFAKAGDWKDAQEFFPDYLDYSITDNKVTVTGYNGDKSEISIPETVTCIGDSAFKNCTGLKCITIGNSVTSIGDSAFWGCTGLTNITIPDSVTSIGYSAFRSCTGLTSITIPKSVTSIGSSAFYCCTGLTGVYITDIAKWCGIMFGNYSANPLYYAYNLYLNGSLVTELTIPDSVTSIGGSAFEDCIRLKSITIPDGVTSIGKWAFCDCTELTNITFRGTKAQWNAISKGYLWDCDTGNYTVHCTDGNISK